MENDKFYVGLNSLYNESGDIMLLVQYKTKLVNFPFANLFLEVAYYHRERGDFGWEMLTKCSEKNDGKGE